MRDFLEKLVNIDRKVIYVLIALAAIIPLIFNLGLPTYETKFTKNVFEQLEEVEPNEAIILSFGFGPSLSPELLPMAKGLLRHCFVRGIKVIGFSFYPAGAAIAQTTMDEIARDYGAIPGEDYVCYGFKTPVLAVILGIGDEIHDIFNVDVRGIPTSELPMMAGIHNYDDINVVIEICGSAIYRSWITYARGRYNQDLAIGCTGIVAAEVYPYLQSKQLLGSIGAIKGAAEYEQMIDRLEEKEDYEKKLNNILKANILEELTSQGLECENLQTEVEERYEFQKMLREHDYRRARTGMDVQAVAHIVIIVLIIVGNIGYFASRKKNKLGT